MCSSSLAEPDPKERVWELQVIKPGIRNGKRNETVKGRQTGDTHKIHATLTSFSIKLDVSNEYVYSGKIKPSTRAN